MRFRLRTLLILLALAPLLLSIGYFQLQQHLAWRHRLEGPFIRQAKFIGNRTVSDKKLLKITGISQGIRLNAYTADHSRRQLQAFYSEQGYSQARITLLEGTHPKAKALVFQIAEGPKRSP